MRASLRMPRLFLEEWGNLTLPPSGERRFTYMSRGAFLLSAIGITLVLSGCQGVPTMPDKPGPKVIAEMAKPGTVLIQTTYTAQLSVPSIALNEAALNQLQQQVLAAQAQGASQEELLDAVINELLTNFDRYFVPSPPMNRVNAQIDGIGSGFFVTPDGYLVTNAHVVTDDPDNLRTALAQNALQQLIQKDVEDFVNELGGAAKPEHIEKLQKVAANFYATHLQIADLERAVAVHLGASVPGVVSATKPVAAEVIESAVGEPIPGKDVAILKISDTDCPTLEIGDDTTVDVGEPLYPYGYPADATFFAAFDASSINEPSLTQGLASARKKMQGGWEVIQTDAAIRGGNSGGPVFDEHGKVVGLSTFGLKDASSGAAAEGANFIVPISVVKEFLQRANVTPQLSKTSQLWREAVLLREEGRNSDALERLKQLDALRPGTPAVQTRLQETQKAILEGNDKRGTPILLYGALAVAGIVVIFLVAKAMAKKPQTGGSAAPTPTTMNLPSGQEGPEGQLPPGDDKDESHG
ncbi:MAG: serine protease [Armatimonadetes bacterium]|nr:MAG: serine protease [Armatimonadota bacterium]